MFCYFYPKLTLLIQGVCQIKEVIFPDISVISTVFPDSAYVLRKYYTTHIGDNLNTYHYASLFKQTLAHLKTKNRKHKHYI